MKNQILDFPKQFKKGLELAAHIKNGNDFDNVIFSGMGGSALPGDILADWLNLPNFHVNRGYTLPSWMNKNTLAICCSYSGNTEECLSAYQEAQKKGLKTIVITSGGKIGELADTEQVPNANIPKGMVPRMAAGYMFSALCTVLVNHNIIEKKLLDEVAGLAELDAQKQEEYGKQLARKLKGKIPIIYSSYQMRSLSYDWKSSFNENAKVPSFAHCFSEMNHNELEGFGSKNLISQFHIIILRDKGGHPQITKRIQLTAEILKEKGLSVETLDLIGNTLLEKIFSSAILADWASYYLALEYGVDPEDTPAIEGFKEKMGK